MFVTPINKQEVWCSKMIDWFMVLGRSGMDAWLHKADALHSRCYLSSFLAAWMSSFKRSTVQVPCTALQHTYKLIIHLQFVYSHALWDLCIILNYTNWEKSAREPCMTFNLPSGESLKKPITLSAAFSNSSLARAPVERVNFSHQTLSF